MPAFATARRRAQPPRATAQTGWQRSRYPCREPRVKRIRHQEPSVEMAGPPRASVTGSRAAGRTGGPGLARLRADAQRSSDVDVSNRAAACRNRLDVERRQSQRYTADTAFGHHTRLTAGDDRKVRRSPAHIEGHQITHAEFLGHFRTGNDAARRAREQHGGRIVACRASVASRHPTASGAGGATLSAQAPGRASD